MRLRKRLRLTAESAWAVLSSPGAQPWLLTGLALALRLLRLGFQPLWWDEGWSLYFARTDLGAMLRLTAVDIHPPLYYALLHLWTAAFGASPAAVRLLSVLIGTATVPILFATGRRILGRTGGLLAAVMLAVSPFHVFYSQEVRMYAVVTLLGLAALWFALDLEEGRRRGAWLGYVLAAAAALYTQYYAGFLLLGLNLAVGVRWLRGRLPPAALFAWLTAQAATAILFLPWALYAGGKLLTYVQYKVSVEGDRSWGPLAYAGRHLAALTMGHTEPIAGGWWLGLLPLVVLLVCLGSHLRRQNGGWPRPPAALDAPLAILGVTLLCGFVVNLILPFNPPRGERLLLLALPAYLLLAAALLARRTWRLAAGSAVLFLAASLLSLGLFYAVPRYSDDDYRPVAARLRALARPEDAILCVHPWQVGYLESYLPAQTRPALLLTPREVVPRERQLWADDPARMAADLDAILAQHGRLWFTDHRAMGRVLESQIETYLVEHAFPVQSEWYGENTVLSLFAAGEPVAQPVAARFGDWLVLADVAVSPGPLEAGWAVIGVEQTWLLLRQPAEDYTVGLRLVGPTDIVWAQRDAWPRGGLERFPEWPLDRPRPDRHGLLIPAGTPPGEYRVTLQVYRTKDVAVLPAAFEGGSGGEVTLGTVRVVRPAVYPPVEALAITQRLELFFGDRLRLLGYQIGSSLEARPGEAVEVTLSWQALSDPGEDFLPRLQLVNAEKVVAEVVEKPVAGTYPTAWWKGGELVRDPHSLPIPAAVPAGNYSLLLSVVRAAGGQPVTIRGDQATVRLAEVQVVSREHHMQPTLPQHPQIGRLGSSVDLAGYDIAEEVRAPGSPLRVTLHWHALATPDRAYYAFVHLLDADGEIAAQHDGPPAEGDVPTLGWLPGEYLTDTHLLHLPSDLPDGSYRLGVGLFDPVTDQRLGAQILLETAVEVNAGEGCLCP